MNDQLVGKRILILGLARQGKAMARFAVAAGARVTISDLRSQEQLTDLLDELSGLPIEYCLGSHPDSLLAETDILAISGGVPADAPFVQRAREQGIEITNDSQEFIRRVSVPTIGITGSAGKSTTTSLVGVMAESGELTSWVGGNIGRPLISELGKIQVGDIVVQELSSFQLEIWQSSPQVAAVLNITPNHLDRHRTMQVYQEAKANIVRYQREDGVAVLNADDRLVMELVPLVNGRLRLFSLEQEVDDGAFIRGGEIILRGGGREEVVCQVEEMKLRGRHNLANVLAAVLLADSVQIPLLAMREAIRQFTGVPHRLELVRVLDGVHYINDSIATAPERALAALAAFEEPVILLAGGKDKELEWELWAQQVKKRVKTVILFGELAGMLLSCLSISEGPEDYRRGKRNPQDNFRLEIVRVDTLVEAIYAANARAKSGDLVLLSPGGSSFDAFIDFAERGELFRKVVGELVERKQQKVVAYGNS